MIKLYFIYKILLIKIIQLYLQYIYKYFIFCFYLSMIFIKKTFTPEPRYKIKHTIQDFIKTKKHFIYASKIYLYVNHHKINFYDEIHALILNNIFLYIVMKNTRIIIFNIEDLEVVSIYEGVCDQISDVKFSNTYIYILTKSNLLYKTLFTDLKYELVQINIQMFGVNKTDNLVLVDLVFTLFYKNEEELFVKDLKSVDFVGGVLKVYDTCFSIADNIEKLNKLDFYKNNFICTQKYVYDLTNLNCYKLSNIQNIKICDDKIFYLKDNFLFEMKF